MRVCGSGRKRAVHRCSLSLIVRSPSPRTPGELSPQASPAQAAPTHHAPREPCTRTLLHERAPTPSTSRFDCSILLVLTRSVRAPAGHEKMRAPAAAPGDGAPGSEEPALIKMTNQCKLDDGMPVRAHKGCRVVPCGAAACSKRTARPTAAPPNPAACTTRASAVILSCTLPA